MSTETAALRCSCNVHGCQGPSELQALGSIASGLRRANVGEYIGAMACEGEIVLRMRISGINSLEIIAGDSQMEEELCERLQAALPALESLKDAMRADL